MPVQNVLDDGKAKPSSAFLAARRHADAVKPLGKPRQVFGRNPRTIIADRQHEAGSTPPALSLVGDLHPDPSPGFAVLQGVLNEILQELDDFVAIAADDGRRRQLPQLDASPRGT